MDVFQRALDIVFLHEGGYVNDPSDSGGETKYGISQRSYPHLDIRALTREQAAEIYRRDFWGPAGCPLLPDDVAIKVFDTAVNMGVRQASKLLQLALNAHLGLRLAVDGVVGPLTIAAAGRAQPAALLREVRAQQALFYAELAIRRPKDRKYLLGWMRRAAS